MFSEVIGFHMLERASKFESFGFVICFLILSSLFSGLIVSVEYAVNHIMCSLEELTNHGVYATLEQTLIIAIAIGF